MEENATKEVTVRFGDLWKVLKRCWLWALIALVLISVLSYVLMSARRTDEFESTSSIFVLRQPEKTATSSQDVSVATNLINDCVEVVTSDAVLERVIADLSLNMGPDRLRTMIDTKNATDTRVLYITVTAEDANLAANITNSVQTQLCNYFNAYLLGGQELLKPIDKGQVATVPSNPVSMLLVALFGIVAAAAVFAVFLILFMTDDKINGTEDVINYLGVPVLGDIPNKNESRRRRRSKNGYYYYHRAYKNSGHTSGRNGG